VQHKPQLARHPSPIVDGPTAIPYPKNPNSIVFPPSSTTALPNCYHPHSACNPNSILELDFAVAITSIASGGALIIAEFAHE
jgi:hypothetical protein